MNSFRTEVFPEKATFEIYPDNTVLLLGSCFAQNIGGYLQQHAFNTKVNPFGVLYNPLSVFNAINLLLNKEKYTEFDLYHYNSQWLSFDHYSAFSHYNKNTCLDNINKHFIESKEFIATTKFLFITFGTSWAYKLNENNRLVANCHKIPANKFKRFFISKDEIIEYFENTLNLLSKTCKDLQIIFTVSPIRHWKEGASENQVSKSNLILAVNSLTKTHQNVSYFPAYEIMMDDLRDYRFYNSDMLHPNEQAIKYIWLRFSETFFSTKTINYLKETERLIKALNHKPVNPKSKNHIEFLKEQLNFAYALEKKYNHNLSKYINELENRIDLYGNPGDN